MFGPMIWIDRAHLGTVRSRRHYCSRLPGCGVVVAIPPGLLDARRLLGSATDAATRMEKMSRQYKCWQGLQCPRLRSGSR